MGEYQGRMYSKKYIPILGNTHKFTLYELQNKNAQLQDYVIIYLNLSDSDFFRNFILFRSPCLYTLTNLNDR